MKFLILGLLVWFAACTETVSPDTVINELKSARTSQQEKMVFEKIQDNFRTKGLGFSAYDEKGSQIDVQAKDWPTRLHRIQLKLGKVTIGHTLVDSQNIFILMRE